MQMLYTSQYLGFFGTSLLAYLHRQQGACGTRPKETGPLSKGKPPHHGWFYQNRLNIALVILASATVMSVAIHTVTPVLAKSLADGLPASWTRTSSGRMLHNLDLTQLRPSTTTSTERDTLQTRFASLKGAPEGAPPYRLLFRHSTMNGATLLSLPGGEIIVTDEFLHSVPDPDEQLALLCHELGHLYYHHALRSAIENNLFQLAYAAFIGSSDDSIDALTQGLRKSNYTLEHVLEADHYAVSMLHANNLPTSLLIRAIEHGQQPANPTWPHTDLLSHRQFFSERIRALESSPKL